MSNRVLTRLERIVAAGTRRDIEGLDRTDYLFLAAFLSIGLTLRLALAVIFPSVHHPDETFQYWEQGYRLAFGQGMVPWEYRDGIRSYLIPGALAGLMRLTDAFGGGMGAWRTLIQFVLSLLSLSIVATAYGWAKRCSGREAAVLAGLVACTWFELLYFSPKPLMEVLAAAALFPAAYLLCASRITLPRFALGGVLLGLTIVIRFQLAPAVAVIALATALSNTPLNTIFAASAAVLVVLAGGALDWVTLGSPFQSIWLNFAINAVHDKASQFGTQPVFWYLLSYFNAWPGIAIPLFALIGVGARKAPLLLAVALAIVLTHSAIGHKEYRFVYPALPFLLLLAALGTTTVYNRIAKALFPMQWRVGFVVMAGLWVATSINLAAQDGYRVNFIKSSDPIRAFELISSLPQVCGIGLVGIGWVDTPGYRGLGLDVPIYPLASKADAERLAPAFNVVVKRRSDWRAIEDEYHGVGGSNGTSVAQRSGGCAPSAPDMVNAYLARVGQ